jgi:acyl dehydratase
MEASDHGYPKMGELRAKRGQPPRQHAFGPVRHRLQNEHEDQLCAEKEGVQIPIFLLLPAHLLASFFLLSQDPRVGTLVVGGYWEVVRKIGSADVHSYAQLLGDTNPVHLDPVYAATTRWKRPIAHGMIAAGLIPTIFGASISGCVYVDQTLRFKRPVYVGESVRARVTVVEVKGAGAGGAGAGAGVGGATAAASAPAAGKGVMVTCSTVVYKEEDGKVVIDGTATVLLPPPSPEIR